jgi:hypothetical protein
MEEFRDTLSSCDLYDIGFHGLPFTWDNGRSGNANVRVRHDRAVADPQWRDAFDDAWVSHLVSSWSDHCPILVQLKRDVWEPQKTRTFQYEIMFERVESLSEEIKKVWCSSNDKGNLGGVVSALRSVQKALRLWSQEHFSAVTREFAGLQCELEEIKSKPVVCKKETRTISDRMDELLFWEEMMWLQQSRISWLREGDRNTGFSTVRPSGERGRTKSDA